MYGWHNFFDWWLNFYQLIASGSIKTFSEWLILVKKEISQSKCENPYAQLYNKIKNYHECEVCGIRAGGSYHTCSNLLYWIRVAIYISNISF